ncbi:MAG: hypothetical protein QNJ68_14305 [Microcoleaceae cyanobacterium MO_207.B10]|nr:hypothetical protein [Microcoleaceae cyanobacterium MO_207.B10]
MREESGINSQNVKVINLSKMVVVIELREAGIGNREQGTVDC